MFLSNHLHTGCSTGDFTAEQLERAALPIPEGNSDRRGGLNIDPGTDSEGEELKQRAAENSDIFEGEGGDSTELKTLRCWFWCFSCSLF